MKKTRWLISSVAVAAIAILGAGTVKLVAVAHAEEPDLDGAMSMHHGPGRQMIAAHIEDALDAALVPANERALVHAARDRAMAGIDDQRSVHRADVDQLLTLFVADRIDGKALAQLRASEEQLGESAATAITTALSDAHAALTPVERQKIADWAQAQANHHALKDHPHFANFMKGRMTAHIDSVLDKANVAAAERPQILAAVEHVFSTFAADGQSHQARMAEALALWREDTVDPAAVQKLRQAGVADRRAAGDAIVQAINDIHDALTPTERQALATQLRAQLAAHGHHSE